MWARGLIVCVLVTSCAGPGSDGFDSGHAGSSGLGGTGGCGTGSAGGCGGGGGPGGCDGVPPFSCLRDCYNEVDFASPVCVEGAWRCEDGRVSSLDCGTCPGLHLSGEVCDRESQDWVCNPPADVLSTCLNGTICRRCEWDALPYDDGSCSCTCVEVKFGDLVGERVECRPSGG